jgi:hypothetical protein
MPEEKEVAEEMLRADALPVLCEWLQKAERESYNWRKNRHNIAFRLIKGELLMDEEENWAYNY